MARAIESRQWSTLWDLSDERWAEVVEPALRALRALPDHDTPRPRRAHDNVVVLTPAGRRRLSRPGPGGAGPDQQTVRTTPVERAQRATPRGVEAIDGSREKDHVAMDIATNRVTGST